MTNYIGVDVSKNSFDAHSASLGSRQFSNDGTGFKLFKKWIGESSHVVMEASGPYYLRLADDLHRFDFPVSVINPLVIRRFCQMNLQRAKTDRKDAEAIAQFAQLTNPQVWSPAPEHVQQLLQMQSVMEQLSKQLSGTRNALESLNQHPRICESALKSLQQIELAQRQQVTQLEKEIMALTKQHYQTEFNSLISIPGIGKKTAVLLILSTHGFNRFENIKQLVAYTGIAPLFFSQAKRSTRNPRSANWAWQI